MEKTELENCNGRNCNVYMRSRPPSVKHTFKWTVENFSSIPAHKELNCPEFDIISLGKWKVTLYKNTELEVKLSNKEGPIVQVKFELFLYDCKGALLYSNSGVATKGDCSHEIGRLSISALQGLPKNELAVVCLLEVFKVNEFQTLCYEFYKPNDEKENLISLSLDLQKLLNDSSTADVTLKASDGVLFAHKAILSGRSSVFAKMFEDGIDGKKKHSIELNMERAALKHLLCFIYSGTIGDVSFNTICDLHCCADKFDLPDLGNECEKLLISRLEVDNACKALYFADFFNNGPLKKLIMGYIHCYLELVLKTPAYKTMATNNPILSMEVMNLLLKKHSQE